MTIKIHPEPGPALDLPPGPGLPCDARDPDAVQALRAGSETYQRSVLRQAAHYADGRQPVALGSLLACLRDWRLQLDDAHQESPAPAGGPDDYRALADRGHTSCRQAWNWAQAEYGPQLPDWSDDPDPDTGPVNGPHWDFFMLAGHGTALAETTAYWLTLLEYEKWPANVRQGLRCVVDAASDRLAHCNTELSATPPNVPLGRRGTRRLVAETKDRINKTLQSIRDHRELLARFTPVIYSDTVLASTALTDRADACLPSVRDELGLWVADIRDEDPADDDEAPDLFAYRDQGRVYVQTADDPYPAAVPLERVYEHLESLTGMLEQAPQDGSYDALRSRLVADATLLLRKLNAGLCYATDQQWDRFFEAVAGVTTRQDLSKQVTLHLAAGQFPLAMEIHERFTGGEQPILSATAASAAVAAAQAAGASPDQLLELSFVLGYEPAALGVERHRAPRWPEVQSLLEAARALNPNVPLRLLSDIVGAHEDDPALARYLDDWEPWSSDLMEDDHDDAYDD